MGKVPTSDANNKSTETISEVSTVPTSDTSNILPRANKMKEKNLKVTNEEKHTKIVEVPTSNTKNI
ncbi:494_t:CDS:2 [Gigaspora margarita]|uniref:494_t:CDS:1 n=1 Tax=Gigaspora margarita TaxID=4874 RepID=A0ABM8W2P3_GIGMA|nr:494_t:CDS:2 [Gigaspora margarita]